MEQTLAPTPRGTSLDEALRKAAREPIGMRPPTWTPVWDLKETPKETAVLIDLPGLDEDAIEIRLDGDLLIVAGEREFDHDYDDAEDFTRLDRPFGPFQCRIPLVHGADLDRATAKYKRGVLKVRLPRTAETTRRGVRIELD